MLEKTKTFKCDTCTSILSTVINKEHRINTKDHIFIEGTLGFYNAKEQKATRHNNYSRNYYGQNVYHFCNATCLQKYIKLHYILQK